MKDFIGCAVPKKGPAEKLNLSTLCIYKQAVNKKAAEAIITGEFYQVYGDIAEHYFDLKVFEYATGTDRPALNKWSTGFSWDKENGSIHLMPINEETNADSVTETSSEEIVDVMKLPTNFRAAVLVRHGPVRGITKEQYSRVLDFVNDDEPSFDRELAEAITRTPRILALHPERQEEELAAVRASVKKTAQWTEIKKFIDKRLDTPPEKRDTVKVQRTPSGAIAGGLNRTDRGVEFVMTTDVLALEIALGIVGRAMDFDIYNPPASIVNRAREIVNTKEKPFPSWFDAMRASPGILDYSRASVVWVVKCAPEGLPLAPGSLIEYLNRTLTETDHEHPAQEIIDAACGIKATSNNDERTNAPVSLNFSQQIAVAMYAPDIPPNEVTAEILEAAMLELQNENPVFIRAQKSLTYIQAELEKFSDEQIFGAVRSVDFNTIQGNVMYRRTALNWLGVSGNNDEDEVEQNSQSATSSLGNGSEEAGSMEQNTVNTGEPTQEVKSGRTVFTLDELVAGPDDTRASMPDREIEIAIAVNDALCAAGNIMSRDEAAELIAQIGRPVEIVVEHLTSAFLNADARLAPYPLSDEEIHYLTLDCLESWDKYSDTLSEFIYASAIEWREHQENKQAHHGNANAQTADATPEPESEEQHRSTLTYHQQITIAAIQGLCANPACFGSFDDIPGMADSLADGVLNIQGHPHE